MRCSNRPKVTLRQDPLVLDCDFRLSSKFRILGYGGGSQTPKNKCFGCTGGAPDLRTNSFWGTGDPRPLTN